MPDPSSVYSQLAASTIAAWAQKLAQDNIFHRIAVFAWLKSLQKAASPGRECVEPVLYGENATADAYTKGATVPMAAQDVVTAARFGIKKYMAAMLVNDEDAEDNAGRAQMVDLIGAMILSTEESIAGNMSADLWGTGLGAGAELAGLQVIVDTTSDIGDIDVSAQAWWQAHQYTTAEAINTRRMASIKNQCSQGKTGNQPGEWLVVMTAALWEAFEDLILPHQHIDGKIMGALGFDSIRWKGTEVVWDEDCPSGQIYILNRNALRLRPQANYVKKYKHQAVVLANATATNHIVSWRGSLTTNERRKLGKLTNVTVP